MCGDAAIRDERRLVKLGGRKSHDRCVHPVLRRESPGDAGAETSDQPLHERDGQALAGRCVRNNRRRKLAMIPGQDHAAGAEQWNPARRLDGLRGFVDDGQIELPLAKDLAIEAGERRAHDGGRVEQVLGDLIFNAAGISDELPGFGPHLLPRSGQRPRACIARRFVEELIGFANQPAGDGHVRMGIDEQIERVLLQLRQDARRVSDADGPLAAADEALQQVIDGQIAGSTGKDPFAAADAGQDAVLFRPSIGGNDERDVLADRLGLRPAEGALGGRIPGRDDAVEGLADDDVVRGLHDGGQSLPGERVAFVAAIRVGLGPHRSGVGQRASIRCRRGGRRNRKEFSSSGHGRQELRRPSTSRSRPRYSLAGRGWCRSGDSNPDTLAGTRP